MGTKGPNIKFSAGASEKDGDGLFALVQRENVFEGPRKRARKRIFKF